MIGKKFKLIFFSEDLSKKVELTLTQTKVFVLGTAFIASCLLVNLTISLSVSRFLVSHRLSTYETERKAVNEQLGGIRNRLDQAEGNLASLAQTDDFLRLLANLPSLGHDVREVGVGGGLEDLGSISSSPEMQPVLWTMERVEREIQLQTASFQEISSRLLANQEIMDRTPSLRPVEGGYISSSFGYRRDPFTRRTEMHPGVDIPQKTGTPVVATANGQVVYADRYYSYGKLIIIDHGNDYQSVYGHLNAISVEVGNHVQKGQQIGTVGATGRVTAPHLHYEIRLAGSPIDPTDYFFEELSALPSR
jgi:murein DD-endopeptidase MepM/ murein hydrolase activator NlpD